LGRSRDHSWRAADGERDQKWCKPLHAKKESSSPSSCYQSRSIGE
jgi:hypothetical protein